MNERTVIRVHEVEGDEGKKGRNETERKYEEEKEGELVKEIVVKKKEVVGGLTKKRVTQ